MITTLQEWADGHKNLGKSQCVLKHRVEAVNKNFLLKGIDPRKPSTVIPSFFISILWEWHTILKSSILEEESTACLHSKFKTITKYNIATLKLISPWAKHILYYVFSKVKGHYCVHKLYLDLLFMITSVWWYKKNILFYKIS